MSKNYFMLAYNLRPEMLFSDRNLRTAVELCIDKPATVDAATDGTGDVIYSPIEPVSWAYEPDLSRPERDVAEQQDRGRLVDQQAGLVIERNGLKTLVRVVDALFESLERLPG